VGAEDGHDERDHVLGDSGRVLTLEAQGRAGEGERDKAEHEHEHAQLGAPAACRDLLLRLAAERRGGHR
jgi:hypothetical protein